MALLIQIALLTLATPAVLQCAYLLLQTLLSGRIRPPPPSTGRLKFDVVVPAHNESAGIARTVTSILRAEWPRDRLRVLVVADNCTDDTAALARAAGATVLERVDEKDRGKGYALRAAFAKSAQDGFAEAVVVIDADAEVSPNLLEAFARRIEAGAQVIQAHYGVLNPNASWRTRLMTIAKGSFHIVRSRARERLGVSCGVRGNGWCVTHETLRQVPYEAFSLTEDLEYGITLGLAGVRVAYADEAHADADMVTGGEIAAKQRSRWEGGRTQLVRSRTLPLLAAAISRRDPVCLDLACDLMVMPLSNIAVNVIALGALAALAAPWFAVARPWFVLACVCAAMMSAYVIRGWQLSGIGARGLLDMCHAPGFLAWKLLLLLRRPRTSDWVRTEREQPKMKTVE